MLNYFISLSSETQMKKNCELVFNQFREKLTDVKSKLRCIKRTREASKYNIYKIRANLYENLLKLLINQEWKQQQIEKIRELIKNNTNANEVVLYIEMKIKPTIIVKDKTSLEKYQINEYDLCPNKPLKIQLRKTVDYLKKIHRENDISKMDKAEDLMYTLEKNITFPDYYKKLIYDLDEQLIYLSNLWMRKIEEYIDSIVHSEDFKENIINQLKEAYDEENYKSVSLEFIANYTINTKVI